MKSKKRLLPEDDFQNRESPLTELLENNRHIRSVRNLVVGALLCLIVNTILEDCFQNGETQFGLRLIKYSSGKLHIVALFWLIFVGIGLLCYSSFIMWAKARINLFPRSRSVKLLDSSCLSLLIGYYIFTFCMPVYLVRTFDLPPASAGMVMAEQVRISMKVHAFVRSTAPKVLNYKLHNEDPIKLPTFWNFLYFMFVPTLIYKDKYPRTKSIRWTFALCRLLEVPAEILCFSVVAEYMLPPFRDFGTRKFSYIEIIIAVVRNTVPAMIVVLLIFSTVLHSVQNFFAELLLFGDRAIYSDWWTSTEISEFYRKWNVVVHNWLYIFVYREIKLLAPKNKFAAPIAVIVISALVHDWAFCTCVGVLFPVFSIVYLSLGMVLYFVKLPKNNIFNLLFLYQLALGTSTILGLYALEYYARLNAPMRDSGLWSRILPRWLTCDCFLD